MSRFLLVLSLAGFAVAIWSLFASSLIRPASSELLSNDVNTAMDAHGFSPQEKEVILLRIAETKAVHSAEVQRYADAYTISFVGLFVFSSSLFVAYVFFKPKRADFTRNL